MSETLMYRVEICREKFNPFTFDPLTITKWYAEGFDPFNGWLHGVRTVVSSNCVNTGPNAAFKSSVVASVKAIILTSFVKESAITMAFSKCLPFNIFALKIAKELPTNFNFSRVLKSVLNLST